MTIAFVDGPVITGDGRILEHATVLVENDKIVKVAEGNISLPQNTQKIPIDGMTLLPGFIDSHIHICLDGSPDPVSTMTAESQTVTTLKAARAARQTLLAGVTTVRDMGGKNGIDLGLKQAIDSGLIPGPRMQVSGRLILSFTGGFPCGFLFPGCVTGFVCDGGASLLLLFQLWFWLSFGIRIQRCNYTSNVNGIPFGGNDADLA